MEFIKKLSMNAVITAILTVVVGIVFIVNPSGSTDFIVMLLGVILLIAGIFDLIMYLKNAGNPFVTRNELLTGVLKLILAVFILRKPDSIVTLISFMFSIYVIIDGLKGLSNAVTLGRIKAGGWIVNLILSIAIIIAGAVLLFNPMEAVGTAATIMGIILVVDGLSALFTLIRLKQLGVEIRRTFKDVKDEIDGNIIDEEDVK